VQAEILTNRRWSAALRLAIAVAPVAVAAGLAAWSLGFGLPYLFRPDEEVMVGRSVHIALEHSLDPLFYNYPPLAFYLFAAAAATAGLLPGHPLGPATQVDPSTAYLAARAVSALAFTAAVALVFWTSLPRRGSAVELRKNPPPVGGGQGGGLAVSTDPREHVGEGVPASRPPPQPSPNGGRGHYFTALPQRGEGENWAGAFVAALCLALAPLAVREAHFATTDTIAMTLVAAAIWAGRRAASRRALLLAGSLAGLAAATRYTAGVVVVFVLVTALYGEDRPRRLLAVLAGSAIAFVAVVAMGGHPLQYIQGLAFLGGRAGQRYGGMPLGLLYHPTVSLPYGLGLGTYALTLAGVGLAIVRRTPFDVALLAYLGAGLAVIGFSHEDFWRYTLPLLPPLCLLAGGLPRLAPAGPGRGLAVAGVLLLQLPSAYASVATDRLLGAEDTRQQAAEWLVRNAPAGSELRISSYWGQPFYDERSLENRPLQPLYLTGNRVADSFQQGRFTERFVVDRPGDPCFTIAESGPPWQAAVPATDGPPLALFRPYAGSAPEGARYDPLDSFYLPIWGFGDLQRPGPSIAIVAGC
jgi:Dolichyl-phosphate-mannose-protein mannosyltransferase